MKNIYFVIPAFNEAQAIFHVVNEVVLAGYEVIVVDDCSSDLTKKLALQAGAIVLSHQINLGQGAALQTGIEYALLSDAHIIVTYDSDGQHRLVDAEQLIKCIAEENIDIAIGSRFLGLQALNMPRSKKWLLRAATIFTQFITNVPVTDAHNGLRAFSRSFAATLNLTQNGMAHATEFIFKIKGHRYKEVPVQVMYSEYSLSKGQKSLNSIKIVIDLISSLFNK
jgi:glycosyltransferase involved in cell wall biosynthesis